MIRLAYLLFLLVGLLPTTTSAQTGQPEADSVETAPADSVLIAEPVALPPAVLFQTGTFDDMLKQAKKENKLILLDFWATWCAPCHRLDRETFTDVPLGDYVNSKFVPYRVNIDDFSGMDLVEKYKVEAYPTMLVVDASGAEVRRLTGFFLPTYLQRELIASETARPTKARKKK
ncbi:thioredoxin family protein [Fibrella aquatilis]|uniref:Thioredoxin family protein n=1 Tax=Fibrella aquatilis TaxID=2817059 RepID=A0A939GB33_9BACT|nr:thioredoxin family protein [Fibrella aquatilis]MBO0933377.1 thioredoxin family protein [Fibrella aquatilis]